ncbi:MAG: alanine racemase [Chlorobi bacterium]|nr:alanine racemase [Chlorobiota bacterium]
MTNDNIDNNLLISANESLRPTHVEINLSAIAENFSKIRELTYPAKVMAILKANAYGHGLVRIAKFMEELGADYLGVAVLEEGILLREEGINMPILVLGGILGNQVPLFLRYDLAITASSIEKLENINAAAEATKTTAKVHLKIDTGLERIGVHYYNAEKFFERAVACKNISIEGVYSHFARATESDLSYTKLQFERFSEAVSFFEKRSIKTPMKHISNSGAILQFPEANLDLVRPGIILFGVYPSNEIEKTIHLEPALSWKSRVVYFKVIKSGHPVGYGSAWETDKNIRAVTVPVGYGDGYFRAMNGKAKVLLNGKKYPVIGNISMDQIVVNIGDDSAFNNDEVVLIGSQNGERISVEDLAGWAGTIPYEILTNINTRVPRKYIKVSGK